LLNVHGLAPPPYPRGDLQTGGCGRIVVGFGDGGQAPACIAGAAGCAQIRRFEPGATVLSGYHVVDLGSPPRAVGSTDLALPVVTLEDELPKSGRPPEGGVSHRGYPPSF
jgi:hypothetical protein